MKAEVPLCRLRFTNVAGVTRMESKFYLTTKSYQMITNMHFKLLSSGGLWTSILEYHQKGELAETCLCLEFSPINQDKNQ